MRLLDDVPEKIDLSKRIDTPAGFYVTAPEPSGLSASEAQFLLFCGIALAALLLVAMVKRKAAMLWLREATLNTAAIGLNTWRAAKTRSGSIGSEIQRRASERNR